MVLTIEDGGLRAYERDERKAPTLLPTIEALQAALARAAANGEMVMRSSSLDFPLEYTTDPMVLAMVNWLDGTGGELLAEGQVEAAHTPETPEGGINWKAVDCIELATVGVDSEQPVATGDEKECVSRIDGDPDAYEFRAHSVYVHRQGIGATCIADCVDRDAARQLGAALAAKLGVPVDDETLDMDAAPAAGETLAPGSCWYLVTCRLDGDDEDSCYVVEAASVEQAASKAEYERRGENDPEAELDGVPEFYLNYVVRCGAEKPEVLHTATM